MQTGRYQQHRDMSQTEVVELVKETEEASRVRAHLGDQPQLHTEFEGSLGYKETFKKQRTRVDSCLASQDRSIFGSGPYSLLLLC